MCGIIGIVGDNIEEQTLEKMLVSQTHRGPDASGIYKEASIHLGHNRLSIIDLSRESNQPFTDISDRYIIVFNGEIYNYIELKSELDYAFNTSSDTEVLLAAYIKWGENCLEKLNGMFSFAIWDKQERKLFAARDRFGVKPLFYAIKDSKLFFASEIKALFAADIPKIKNKKVWSSYFVYGSYGMPDETFWEGVHQLPGGHFMRYLNGNIEIKKWYHFEKEILKYSKKLSYDSIKNKYTEILEDSIRLRFRADVPVGFNVSGGLDSSALLAFVNKQKNNTNINAFTFYTDDERYDELPWVEEMIAITGNPLEKVLLKPKDVLSLIEKINNHQDEPFGGVPTIAYAQIFERAQQKGVKVLLDGQGMDEQWAGYDYYIKKNNSTIQGVSKSPFRKNVLSNEFLKAAKKPVYPKPFYDPILNLQYRDLFYTKIPRALRFNDRVSMAYSTELREPFLDYRLVELAFAQPLVFKIKNGLQKYMLRDIVSENLSSTIAYAPKRPLQTPQREWLAKELKEFTEEKINALAKTAYRSWFNFEEIKLELDNYMNGDIDSSFHIWQWLNFSLFVTEKE